MKARSAKPETGAAEIAQTSQRVLKPLQSSAMRHGMRALRNAFLSRGRQLFGLGFSRDYLRFAWRASRQMGSVGPGSLSIVGLRLDYWNQSYALFLLHEIFVNAEYDFESSSTRPFIIDCGANLGMAVLFFKARYPNARILAFEPEPRTFSGLVHTIESNSLQGVVAEQAAITEHAGAITLYRNSSDSGSIVASIDRAWGGDEGETVRAVRLSDHISTPVDFLKIDIEGAEYAVVRELIATKTIRWVREAAIEYHNLPAMPDALEKMVQALETAGFDVRVRPSTDGSPTGMVHARRVSATLREESGTRPTD